MRGGNVSMNPINDEAVYKLVVVRGLNWEMHKIIVF